MLTIKLATSENQEKLIYINLSQTLLLFFGCLFAMRNPEIKAVQQLANPVEICHNAGKELIANSDELLSY